MLKWECFIGSIIGETASVIGKTHLHVQFKNVNLSYPLSHPSCRTYFSYMGLQETRYSSTANDICRAE